jgi:hypothetical protein
MLSSHSSGGLSQGMPPCQFIPFDPFLAGGMLLVVLPYGGIFSEVAQNLLLIPSYSPLHRHITCEGLSA